MVNVCQVEPESTNTVVRMSSATDTSSLIGPVEDDGEPFCEISHTELLFHRRRLTGGQFVLSETPAELHGCTNWQLGIGHHASHRRRILGSISLHLLTDARVRISVRHVVIDGSSQWALGRNLTSMCNIVHIGSHTLQLPTSDNQVVSMIDHNRHSHISLDRFVPPCQTCSPSLQILRSNQPHSATPCFKLPCQTQTKI